MNGRGRRLERKAFDLSSSSTLTSNNFAKHHVRIINNLNNKLLYYHCKSGDDDLGIRTLQPKGAWNLFSPPLDSFNTFLLLFWYDNFYAAFDVYSAYLAKVGVGTITIGQYRRMDSTYIIQSSLRI
ncbi:s-protein like protein 2 [Quercus suber]|uniref:S-protein homolog n=1 Tax=Quercus suber TaxID=58331 RepID=A0AAW0KM81_QUESU